jgi:copper homeostasis protein
VADARAAAVGGADRLELVRDIRLGGLTPPASLVRAVAAETPLPLRVMVRENAGYGTEAAELAAMCRAAAGFAEIGIDGLVVGFARDGRLLLDGLREVLHAAPGLPATFHRAFDSLSDPLSAIDTLSELPQIDRILTDGVERRPALAGPAGAPPAGAVQPPRKLRRSPGAVAKAESPRRRDRVRRRRCVRLREYSECAGSRMTIIAGSDVDEEMLADIALTRCVREVHVGRAARDGDRESPVTAARVQRLREVLDALPELPRLPESPS